jgi:rhodanese-related sulfurtransferase
MESLRITPEQIGRFGGDVIVIDARSEKAWAAASDKAAGALRVPPDRVAEHLAEIPTGKPIVAYCT